ncbi:hypothetical protein P5673_032440, partial [Acropora cervicornis]
MLTRVLKTHSQQKTRTGNHRCVYCEDKNHADRSTAQRGVRYFQRKGCAITAPAGTIARINVKVDYDARNVPANTTLPF